MKNKFILPLILIALSFSACDKKGKQQYSNWTIDGKNFSTNEVNNTNGKALTFLSTTDKYNGFSFSFYIGGALPQQGSFQMVYDPASSDPSIVSVAFFINGIGYVPTQTPLSFLLASSSKDKAQFKIEPTWFINYNTKADSVLISGTFLEP